MADMAAAVEKGQATIQALQQLLMRSEEALGDRTALEDERSPLPPPASPPPGGGFLSTNKYASLFRRRGNEKKAMKEKARTGYIANWSWKTYVSPYQPHVYEPSRG